MRWLRRSARAAAKVDSYGSVASEADVAAMVETAVSELEG